MHDKHTNAFKEKTHKILLKPTIYHCFYIFLFPKLSEKKNPEQMLIFSSIIKNHCKKIKHMSSVLILKICKRLKNQKTHFLVLFPLRIITETIVFSIKILTSSTKIIFIYLFLVICIQKTIWDWINKNCCNFPMSAIWINNWGLSAPLWLTVAGWYTYSESLVMRAPSTACSAGKKPF